MPAHADACHKRGILLNNAFMEQGGLLRGIV